MSKAILIMDMPKSCDVCEFAAINVMCKGISCTNPLSDEYGCDVTDYIGCRADGCPLKELPREMDIKKAATMTSLTWCEGWNACREKILKGSEENG